MSEEMYGCIWMHYVNACANIMNAMRPTGTHFQLHCSAITTCCDSSTCAVTAQHMQRELRWKQSRRCTEEKTSLLGATAVLDVKCYAGTACRKKDLHVATAVATWLQLRCRETVLGLRKNVSAWHSSVRRNAGRVPAKEVRRNGLLVVYAAHAVPSSDASTLMHSTLSK